MFRTNIILTAVTYVKSYGIAYREIYRITWDFYVIIAKTFNPRTVWNIKLNIELSKEYRPYVSLSIIVVFEIPSTW